MAYVSKYSHLDTGDLEAGSRVCEKCSKNKDIQEFNWTSTGNRVRTCKLCQKKRRKSSSPLIESHYQQSIRKAYGLTLTEFELIYDAADGKCEICKQELGVGGSTGSSVHLDHDHQTGEIRGILCFMCNTALGKFLDSTELLQSAITYLSKPSSSRTFRSKILNKQERSQIAKERWRLYSDSILEERWASKGIIVSEYILDQAYQKYSTGKYKYSDLAEEIGLPVGTLAYHIRKRRKQNAIVSLRESKPFR